MARLGLQLLVLLVLGLCVGLGSAYSSAYSSGSSSGYPAAAFVAAASWIGLAWLATVSVSRGGDPRSAYFAVGLLALSALPIRALGGDLRLVAAFCGTWALRRGAHPPASGGTTRVPTWLLAGSVGGAAALAACAEPRWLPLGLVAVAWALFPPGIRRPEPRTMAGVALGAGLVLLIWFSGGGASWPEAQTPVERAEAWRPLSLERVAAETQALLAGQRTGLIPTAPFFLVGWFGLRQRSGPRSAWPVLAALGVALGAEFAGGASIDRGGFLSVTPALLVLRPRPPVLALGVAVLAFSLLGASLLWRGESSPVARQLLYFETDRIDRLGTHALLESPGPEGRWFWIPAQDLRPGGTAVPAAAHWLVAGADGDWLVLSRRSLPHLDVLISGPASAVVELTSDAERVSVLLDTEEKRRGTPVRLGLADPLESSRLPATPAGVPWAYRFRVRTSEAVLLDFVE